MKTRMKYFVLFGIMIQLLIACNNDSDIEFIQHSGKKQPDRYGDYYSVDVLVKNIRKSYMDQRKIMIAYYDSAGLSIDDIITKMPDVSLYTMFFYIYKVTKYGSVKTNETHLGDVSINRCKGDTTKWRVSVGRNVRLAKNFNEYYSKYLTDLEIVVLSNPCGERPPYWARENEELVNYYNELIDKKNANRKGE